MTGNTLFQSKMSVQCLQIRILHFKMGKKFVFILQEMKSSKKEQLRLRCTPKTPKICKTKTDRSEFYF